jgi:glycosyltransferase involved in cell wall biosynthesis
MLITIGMMAYNEAKAIGDAIASLLSQSVFQQQTPLSGTVRWEILVVPNGCTDNTHEVAHQALTAAVTAVKHAAVSFRVVSLKQGGKSRAWNSLIHDLADLATDMFVMVDSDITFGHADTLLNTCGRMMVEKHARVVVDLALKDFTRFPKKTWLQRLSARYSHEHVTSVHPAIAGSFYCAMAPTLRSIWMPVGLSVEDGFLYSMVVTNNFREPVDYSRVLRVDDASHYFEGLTTISSVVNHEVRLAIGTVLNCFLCWDTLMFMTPHHGEGAGPMIRDLNTNDPQWYENMMKNAARSRGWLVVSRSHLIERWLRWRAKPSREKLGRLPLYVLGTVFDVWVLIQANRRFAKKQAVGHW